MKGKREATEGETGRRWRRRMGGDDRRRPQRRKQTEAVQKSGSAKQRKKEKMQWLVFCSCSRVSRKDEDVHAGKHVQLRGIVRVERKEAEGSRGANEDSSGTGEWRRKLFGWMHRLFCCLCS